MKNEILSTFDALPYFTIEAVKQLADIESLDDGTIRTYLYRWIKSGLVIRLKNGMYMTRRFYERHRPKDGFSPMVSAILIPQSYLSLEFILQRHGVLTEVTYPVTAVTIKQTRVIENEVGTFTYRNIKPDLYTGFTLADHLGIPVARASLGKALFDYFYLRPVRLDGLLKSRDLTEEERLDLSDVGEDERRTFEHFATESHSPKMEIIFKHLRQTVWRH